jgi:predicted DNA-binding ribbon-helix-helix protein
MELARERGVTLSALVAATDAAREGARPLASALRVHALISAKQGQRVLPPGPPREA